MAKEYAVANYITAFLDICGQKRNLERLPSVLGEGITRNEILNVAKSTIGNVLQVQDWFFDFYRESQQEPDVSRVNEADRDRFREAMKSELQYQHFSDGILVYASLFGDDRPLRGLNSLWAMLSAAGGICLLGLAHGIPVRIGVALGWGAEIRPGELYGRGVLDAYEMENKVARFPRVAIGSEVIRFLDVTLRNEHKGIEYAVTRALASLCRSVISQDDEGVFFLNFLGDEFTQAVQHPETETILRRAREFIEGELDNAIHSDDQKLVGRYNELKGYFDRNGIDSGYLGSS